MIPEGKTIITRRRMIITKGIIEITLGSGTIP